MPFSALIWEIVYSYVWSKYIYRICTWFLLNVKENNSVHLFYNNPKFFNTFRIISDPLEPFAPNSLFPFQLVQRHFLLFFWLRSRSISSLLLLFSNLVCNFLSFFVPQPVMVVKFNPKYLEIPKEAIWYLLRFQIHCQCIRRLDARILVQLTNALTMDLKTKVSQCSFWRL